MVTPTTGLPKPFSLAVFVSILPISPFVFSSSSLSIPLIHYLIQFQSLSFCFLVHFFISFSSNYKFSSFSLPHSACLARAAVNLTPYVQEWIIRILLELLIEFYFKPSLLRLCNPLYLCRRP